MDVLHVAPVGINVQIVLHAQQGDHVEKIWKVEGRGEGVISPAPKVLAAKAPRLHLYFTS
jgi:hypothetical protein